MVKPSASRAVTVQNCKTTLRISDYKPYWENGDNGGGRRCGAQKPMRASHIAVAFARPYRPWRDGSRSDLRTARGGAWPWSSTRVQAVKAIARRLAARTQAGGRRLAARTLVEQARGDLPRLPTPAHRGRRQTGAHVAGAPPPAQRPPGPRPPGPLRRSRPQGRRRRSSRARRRRRLPAAGASVPDRPARHRHFRTPCPRRPPPRRSDGPPRRRSPSPRPRASRRRRPRPPGRRPPRRSCRCRCPPA